MSIELDFALFLQMIAQHVSRVFSIRVETESDIDKNSRLFQLSKSVHRKCLD